MTPEIKPGFYRIPEKAYHDGPGLSKSDMSKLLISPAHFKVPKKETKAMILGSAFHTAVLEPLEMSERFMVMPAGVTRVHREGKALAIEAAQTGKELISEDDMNNIQGMATAIWDHPDAKAILEGSEHEISGYWYDTLHPEILCKMRMDVLSTQKGILADIKTTDDARPHVFSRIAYNMGYHIQAGWYSEGAEVITRVPHPDFYFIAVEREPPYGVYVYKAEPAFMVHGLTKAREAVEIYKHCLDTDTWPCYPPDLQTLKLPLWVTRAEQSQLQIIE